MELRNPDARRTRPPAPAIMTSAGPAPGCWHGREELLAFWPAQDGCVLTAGPGSEPSRPESEGAWGWARGGRDRRAGREVWPLVGNVGRAVTMDKRTQRDCGYPSCDRQGRESMPACVCVCVCGRHRWVSAACVCSARLPHEGEISNAADTNTNTLNGRELHHCYRHSQTQSGHTIHQIFNQLISQEFASNGTERLWECKKIHK